MMFVASLVEFFLSKFLELLQDRTRPTWYFWYGPVSLPPKPCEQNCVTVFEIARLEECSRREWNRRESSDLDEARRVSEME
jgi:hypothetical protein